MAQTLGLLCSTCGLDESQGSSPDLSRVLDLGCGTALTSIFLAREFGARVWAADLWIDPNRNWERIREASVAELVTPMRMEAHALPFLEGYFGAIVSVDAYHYFGTDDLYLAWGLSPFLTSGGRIGVVVPGIREEVDEVPESLRPYWGPDLWTMVGTGRRSGTRPRSTAQSTTRPH
jgi:cyclopropane fatty-acyl-phospholipid synthase-like methyltransferase